MKDVLKLKCPELKNTVYEIETLLDGIRSTLEIAGEKSVNWKTNPRNLSV